MAKKKKIKPARGVMVVTIPIGNIPPASVKPYLKSCINDMEPDLDRVKAAGNVVFIVPARPDGTGPKIDYTRV